MQRAARLIPLALALALVPALAHAAGVGVLDTIVGTFQSNAAAMGASLTTDAKELFVGLFVIEFVLAFGFAVAQNANQADLFSLFVRQMVTAGVFWYALVNWSAFSQDITKSFGQFGNNASVAAGGSANLSPSDMVSSGINMAHSVWSGLAWSSPGLDFLLVVAGVIILYCYAKICGLIVEVLIESLIVAYAGIILMGFSGTRYTRDVAVAQFKFAVSVGAKRLVLQLLIGLSERITQGWSTDIASGNMNTTFSNVAVMVAVPIVLLQLCEKLPYRAQDMINGSSTHGGGSLLGRAGGMAAGVAAAGLAVTGFGAAAMAAFNTASKAINGGGSGGGGSGGGGGGGGGGSNGGGGGEVGGESGGGGGFVSQAAQIGAATIGGMGKAAANDIGARLGGGKQARGGIAGFRMARAIKAAAARDSDD